MSHDPTNTACPLNDPQAAAMLRELVDKTTAAMQCTCPKQSPVQQHAGCIKGHLNGIRQVLEAFVIYESPAKLQISSRGACNVVVDDEVEFAGNMQQCAEFLARGRPSMIPDTT